MSTKERKKSSEQKRDENLPLTENGAKEAAEDSGEVKLKAKMSLTNGITVIVGSIIGSGIFVSPTGVLTYTGSVNASLIVWLSSGIFSMVGAYCYAELGCMISKSGADYAYIMETFGPFMAFIRLWIECMIVRPCSQAIVALTFAVYTLKPFYPDCVPPDSALRMLAVTCILLLTFVNCWDVGWATKVQDIFTYAKLVALFIIISTGMYQLYLGVYNVEAGAKNQVVMKWSLVTAVVAVCLCGVLSVDRSKRTIGFLFRNLVDVAANQAEAAHAGQRATTAGRDDTLKRGVMSEKLEVEPTGTAVTTAATAPSPPPPPRPMIYIIPVSNRTPSEKDLNNLSAVLKYAKIAAKLKGGEKGNVSAVDADIKALLEANKQLLVDKRNVRNNSDVEILSQGDKGFAIQIQPPKELDNAKEFSIKIVGDDIKVKKTKTGYALKFVLPDKNAKIKIEYPKKQFDKQEMPTAAVNNFFQPQPSYPTPYYPQIFNPYQYYNSYPNHLQQTQLQLYQQQLQQQQPPAATQDQQKPQQQQPQQPQQTNYADPYNLYYTDPYRQSRGYYDPYTPRQSYYNSYNQPLYPSLPSRLPADFEASASHREQIIQCLSESSDPHALKNCGTSRGA